MNDGSGDKLEGIEAFAAALPQDRKKTVVGIGVAAVPWKTISTIKEKQEVSIGFCKGGEYTIQQPIDHHGGISSEVKMVDTIDRSKYALRMVAMTNSSETITSAVNSTGGSHLTITSHRYMLPLKKIKEFQLQTRPYEWVEFKNVSLKPNFKTDVEVEVESSQTKDEKETNWTVEDDGPTRLLSNKEKINIDNWVSIVASVVKNNGRYLVPDNGLTLKDLIKTAGYNKDKLAESYIELYRRSRQGNLTAFSIYSRNLKTLLIGEESDVAIKPHDAVVGGFIEPSPNAEEFWRRYSFSDVVELTVNDDNVKVDMFADLDTAKLITPPDTLDNKDENAVLTWIKEEGIDVLGETADSVHGLVGFNMYAARVDNYFWDADKIKIADRLLISVDTPVLLSVENFLPVTYLIKTSEHKMGVLQILGFAENPRGIKIRYKLLEKQDAVKSTMPVEVKNGYIRRPWWRISTDTPITVREITHPEGSVFYKKFSEDYLRNLLAKSFEVSAENITKSSYGKGSSPQQTHKKTGFEIPFPYEGIERHRRLVLYQGILKESVYEDIKNTLGALAGGSGAGELQQIFYNTDNTSGSINIHYSKDEENALQIIFTIQEVLTKQKPAVLLEAKEP